MIFSPLETAVFLMLLELPGDGYSLLCSIKQPPRHRTQGNNTGTQQRHLTTKKYRDCNYEMVVQKHQTAPTETPNYNKFRGSKLRKGTETSNYKSTGTPNYEIVLWHQTKNWYRDSKLPTGTEKPNYKKYGTPKYEMVQRHQTIKRRVLRTKKW